MRGGFGRLSRDALPAAPIGAALLVLAFDNGGFFSGAWATVAVGLLWFTALVLLFDDRVELTSFEWAWLGVFALFLAWTALSLTWSINHTEPLLELRRGLVYLGGIGAILVGSTRRSATAIVTAVWASVSVVVVYALGRYLLAPEIRSDQFQANLLFRPVGYANALGILAGIALILALMLAVRASSPSIRMLSAASTAPFAAAISLTSSRASALAVVVGAAAMLALDRERGRPAVCLAVVGPVLAVVVVLSQHSGLTEPGRVPGHVESQGRLLAVWVALAAAVLVAAPRLVDNTAARLTTLRLPPLRVVLPVAAAVVVAGAVVAAGPVDRFFTTGVRPGYWHVAWIQYTDHPGLGSGAGTFADYWLRYGDPNVQGGALDAHNLYLETLAEVGPVGLALLASALALPFVSALRMRSQPFVSAAIGAYVAFLAHAALDWDWEMPAVTLAALFCGTAAVVADRSGERARALSPVVRGGALVVAVGLAVFALAAQVVPGLGGRFR